MQFSVTGQQLDVGDTLRHHPETHPATSMAKYVDGVIEGSSVCSRELRRGIQFRASGDALEPFPAFAMALDHAAKQLRRPKRELRHPRMNNLPEQD